MILVHGFVIVEFVILVTMEANEQRWGLNLQAVHYLETQHLRWQWGNKDGVGGKGKRVE